jgi:hypothetical protein
MNKQQVNKLQEQRRAAALKLRLSRLIGTSV